MEKQNEVLQITAEKISKVTGFSPEQIAIIKANVAKGTTDNELAFFASVCQDMKLSPLKKEVWCYKNKKGDLLIFAGRDGFLSASQQHPDYMGIRSSEVCANDEIEIDVPNAKIKHVYDPRKDRGGIIGAYCIAFGKTTEPIIEWVDFKTYNKGYNAWGTHPAEMIKKVAETHALKKKFGLSGLQIEYDWSVNNEVADPIDASQGKAVLSQDDWRYKRIKGLLRTTNLPDHEVTFYDDQMYDGFPESQANSLIVKLEEHQLRPNEDFIATSQKDILEAVKQRVEREK